MVAFFTLIETGSSPSNKFSQYTIDTPVCLDTALNTFCTGTYLSDSVTVCPLVWAAACKHVTNKRNDVNFMTLSSLCISWLAYQEINPFVYLRKRIIAVICITLFGLVIK